VNLAAAVRSRAVFKRVARNRNRPLRRALSSLAPACRSRDRSSRSERRPWKMADSRQLPRPILPPGDTTTLKGRTWLRRRSEVTMRAMCFDGRGFLKSAMWCKEPKPASRPGTSDFRCRRELGAVAGHDGEAVRSLESNYRERNGTIRSLRAHSNLAGIRHWTGDFARPRRPRVIYLRYHDAGAFFPLRRHLPRCWRPASVGDGSADSRNRRRETGCQHPQFSSVKGESSLDRHRCGRSTGVQNGVSSRHCARIYLANANSGPGWRSVKARWSAGHRGQHRFSPLTRFV